MRAVTFLGPGLFWPFCFNFLGFLVLPCIPQATAFSLLGLDVSKFLRPLIPCSAIECCENKEWSRIRSQTGKSNRQLFSEAYSQEVFGQHIAEAHLKKWLFAHLRDYNPPKALVMSFHGWTGNGKNLMARIVAESLYKNGMKSRNVHYFFSTLHFPKESQIDIYKLQLQDWIRGNISQCERSVFIFDEVDKMPSGLLDAIKVFVDYHETVDEVDHRKSVYIFLSNTGGKAISKKAFELWSEGKRREEMTYQDFEKLIQMGAFNEKGGLHRSDLIDRSLVDIYVPFLPMEKIHVRQCTTAEFRRRGYAATPQEIEDIADRFEYWPPDSQLYSTTGCKRVAQLVSVRIQEREIERFFSEDLKSEL